MTKVTDVMTRSLATCSSDASVAQAARLMRDMNIGDVLIVDQVGKLKGIVTDRDLAVRALTDENDMRLSPVTDYMSTDIVTGQPGWDLKQAAKVMSRHQVRRLPIIEGGKLVGIVSLGDVAVHSRKEQMVGASLKNISETGPQKAAPVGRGLFALFGLAAALGGAVLLASNKGQDIRNRLADEFPELAEGIRNYSRRFKAQADRFDLSQQHMGAQEV